MILNGTIAAIAAYDPPPVPVLSGFVDNLDDDPPSIQFVSSTAGTARWDFHSSETPPAAGAGDIATGSFEVVEGANVASIDLFAHQGETGYLHIRVSRLQVSDVLTSQQATVPAAETVVVDLGDLTGFTGRVDCTTPNASTLQATTQAGAQTPFVRNNTTITAPGTYTLVFDVDAIAGVDNIHVAIQAMDTAISPARAVFDCANGNIPYADTSGTALAARISAKAAGGFTCEYDFGVTSDGAGVIDIGLSERDDAILRLTDPTTSDQATITNARIIQR